MPPGLRPRRSLGQNFLRDENIARKIVKAIQPAPSDVMVEVGPGEGALTRHLARAVGLLIAVDIDERVIGHLEKSFPRRGVEIVHADFLETDLAAISRERVSGGKLRVVGSIPYNITTPILFHVLDQRSAVHDLTVLLQKEVAQRIIAVPGTKDYGILAVFCQLFADVRKLFDVPPGAFFPKPRVVSSLIHLTMREAPRYPVADEEAFRAMVRAVFGKRRKTLRNSLRYFAEGAERVLSGGIDLTRRPEALSIRELVQLSNTLVGRSVTS